MCSLAGTIFFLRSITMLITSLSVPGIHIQCASQRYETLTNQLYGAWSILTGAGLYVSGVRTCGDYMFSGHTVWLTLTTHFISECKWYDYSLIPIVNIYFLYSSYLFHRYLDFNVLAAYNLLGVEHIRTLLYSRLTRALFHRRLCRLLHYLTSLPLLPQSGQ